MAQEYINSEDLVAKISDLLKNPLGYRAEIPILSSPGCFSQLKQLLLQTLDPDGIIGNMDDDPQERRLSDFFNRLQGGDWVTNPNFPPPKPYCSKTEGVWDRDHEVPSRVFPQVVGLVKPEYHPGDGRLGDGVLISAQETGLFLRAYPRTGIALVDGVTQIITPPIAALVNDSDRPNGYEAAYVFPWSIAGALIREGKLDLPLRSIVARPFKFFMHGSVLTELDIDGLFATAQ